MLSATDPLRFPGSKPGSTVPLHEPVKVSEALQSLAKSAAAEPWVPASAETAVEEFARFFLISVRILANLLGLDRQGWGGPSRISAETVSRITASPGRATGAAIAIAANRGNGWPPVSGLPTRRSR